MMPFSFYRKKTDYFKDLFFSLKKWLLIEVLKSHRCHFCLKKLGRAEIIYCRECSEETL